MVTDLDYPRLLREESARFRAALADAEPHAPVPTCPQWTAADLLWHLSEVQLFWGTIVRDRLSDPAASQQAKPDRPADYGALLDLFDGASTALLDALAGADDDVPVWTWFDADQTVGFVRRRQVHEALIHRVDAELTTGVPTGIDPQLATDGVTEVFDWMYSGSPDWASRTDSGPVGRIATSDTGASWLVRVGTWSGVSPNSGTSYDAEAMLTLVPSPDAEPTFEVTGSAADLDTWLWNRPTRGEVSLDGDFAQFQAIIRRGVQ